MVLVPMIAAFLLLAAPATQPFAASHVRPPEGSLGNQPTVAPGETDWTPTVIAAWVQAIGSVLAIVAAVWIADRAYRRSERMFEQTRRRDEVERRLKARSLAIALYPELLDMQQTIQTARHASGEPKLRSLDIPHVLLQSIDRLYLLGDAGAAIQKFVATSRQFNRLVDEIRQHTGGDREADLAPDLEKVESTLTEAEELLSPIHDGKD